MVPPTAFHEPQRGYTAHSRSHSTLVQSQHWNVGLVFFLLYSLLF